MADLKPLYKAPVIDATEDALDALEGQVGKTVSHRDPILAQQMGKFIGILYFEGRLDAALDL